MPQSIRPFLMFQGEGSAALDFYASVFADAVIEEVERYEEGDPFPTGTLKMARVVIAGQTILLNDSPPVHNFSFTPSISLFVECVSEAELQKLAETLKQDGSELMPVGGYGFSRLFAWVSDRFGVSWQLNLP